jgi:hypothetical protein
MLYPIYPQPNGSGFSGRVKGEFCDAEEIGFRAQSGIEPMMSDCTATCAGARAGRIEPLA